MQLTFGTSPLLLLLCVLCAGAFAWWSYHRTTPEQSRLRRVGLASLRFLALSIVLFLLFEPLFSRQRTVVDDPVLGILIDDSESMTFADSVQGAVAMADVLGELDALTATEQRRVFAFNSGITSTDSMATLHFDGSSTDIAGALTALSAELDGATLGAVILLSDGIHNAGANPVRVAERYRVPIITVAHGDSTIQKDVRIVQVITNELAYSGTEVPVRVRVRNDGFTAQPVEILLSSGGQTVDRQTVTLPAMSGEVVVDLTFVPVVPGLARLQVDVSRLTGEATWRNNTETISIQVLDQKKQVLLVAGAPSPDVSAWTRLLDSDPDVELVSRVQSGPGRYFQGILPDSLDAFDLLILVGFPGTATDPTHSRRLADAASAGLPTLFVLDHATDFRMMQRDWQDILPAVPSTIRTSWTQVAFAPTPLSASHAIFETGLRRDAGVWQRLPPLRTSETGWSLQPGSQVLSESRVRNVTLDDPLFVTGRSGRVRTAALLANGFWRWQNVPEDLTDEAEAWSDVQSNLLQWLYVADDERLVRVVPAQPVFSDGEPVIMRGEVYDEALEPVNEASVTITVRSPDGTDLPVGMQPVGNGRYVADFGRLPGGVYSYSASASNNNAEIGSDRGEFVVGDRSVEFRNTRADYGLMRQLAALSGGASISSSRLDALPDILADLDSYRAVDRVENNQIRLWQRYPFLILVILLLTVEWFLRKRFGLV